MIHLPLAHTSDEWVEKPVNGLRTISLPAGFPVCQGASCKYDINQFQFKLEGTTNYNKIRGSDAHIF